MHDLDQISLEAEAFDMDRREAPPGPAGGTRAPHGLDEMQELELTSELLEVSGEAELEQFLGGLLRAAGRFVRSDTGRALGAVLKDAARQALPAAGHALGLELEGLSPEDREFETARQFVRFAAAAARRAAAAQPGAAPGETARDAAAAAARLYAPGLLPRLQGRSSALWPRTGRWVRQGRTIVLYGG